MERDSKEMEQEFVTTILMERDSKEIEQESITSIEGERELEKLEHKFVTAIEGYGDECGISKLPQEMKEMIFAKLPFESICSSLTVCKEWNCILSSQSFLSSLPTQNPWLLMCDKKENGNWNCVAYCFTTRKWRELSLSFLPLFSFRDLSSTGQGLLLFRETAIERLNVCNPLLRSYTEIEMDLDNKFVGVVDGGNKEPYLVVFSNWEKFSFEIYHYFQDSWRTKFQFEGEMRSDIFGNEIIECNGVLFWMGITPATIIGYKIQDEGLISPVTVAPLPLQMVHDLQLYDLSMFHGFSMVSYGSSVLVVATFLEKPSAVNRGVMFHDELKQRGIVIWELFPDQEDELVWKWKEFSRIPPHSLPQHFDEIFYSRLNCICVGDYLCFSGLFPVGSPMVFALNLREGFWQSLFPSYIKQTVMWAKMMSFEPKFNYQLFQK